ncbi:MAG: hypothetical protein ACM3UR_11565 [Bacteroidota bacterium]|jgi:hypothetical protein|nr:hypothetical protein [Ignavibacteria bacterium]MCU7514089.1 hypothetical protein [Ignavibacteria bacterium]MCU7525785.1 hypothetical protein [Ignavibacteria bacterium]
MISKSDSVTKGSYKWLGELSRTQQGKRLLDFIQENKLKEKFLGETSWFLLSNMIYSASTYLVGFLIPYLLNTDYMAFFSSGNQILMVLAFIFELGFSVSFLRFYQLDQSVKYINSYLQMILFGVIIIIGLYFSTFFDKVFNIDELPVDSSLLYFLVIAQLAWFFIKNWLLAINKIKTLVFHSVLILLLRVVFLLHLYYLKDFSIRQLFLETLLYPFSITMIHLLYVNVRLILESLSLYNIFSFSLIRKAAQKVYSFLRFSLLTYISGFLYLYTVRYLVIFMTGKNNMVVADLGYAMTFIGIILVFYTTFRSYLIARLSMDKADFIRSYIANIKSMYWHFMVLIVFSSLALSYIVYLIRPGYLSFNTVIFSFILFMSTFMNVYLGLITVLSKTYDYNKMEVLLNIIRFLMVVVITNFLVESHLILGVTLVNIVMVLGEYVYAKILIRRINYVQA